VYSLRDILRSVYFTQWWQYVIRYWTNERVIVGELGRALCSRVVAAKGEVLEKGHTVEQAKYGRDALAKVLYCHCCSIRVFDNSFLPYFYCLCFSYIVCFVNCVWCLVLVLMCIFRATVSAVSCLVVPAFICIDLLISCALKLNEMKMKWNGFPVFRFVIFLGFRFWDFREQIRLGHKIPTQEEHPIGPLHHSPCHTALCKL